MRVQRIRENISTKSSKIAIRENLALYGIYVNEDIRVCQFGIVVSWLSPDVYYCCTLPHSQALPIFSYHFCMPSKKLEMGRVVVHGQCSDVVLAMWNWMWPIRCPCNCLRKRLEYNCYNSHSNLWDVLIIGTYTVFIQIKRMIQSSARNSILGLYGWIQLSASRH